MDMEDDCEMDMEMEENVRLDAVETKMARLEKMFHLLESRLNQKIMWIMTNVHVNQKKPTAGGVFSPPQLERRRPRILSRVVPRNPRVERFIIPEIHYGDDDDEEDGGLKEYNTGGVEDTKWNSTAGNSNSNEDFNYENSQARSEDPLAIDEDEEEEREQEFKDSGATTQHEHDTEKASTWRYTLSEEEEEEPEQEGEDYNSVSNNKSDFVDETKPYLFENVEIEDASEPTFSVVRSSKPRILRRPTNPIVYSRNRVLPSSRPNLKSVGGLIIPRNRYLMSASTAAALRLQHKFSSKLTEIKPKLLSRPILPANANPATGSTDKEKVYYCDRCPLTFTLSTRLAHFELHKKLDFKKRAQDPTKPVSTDNVPASTSSTQSPSPAVTVPGRKRTRARKICPICTKSYSRNQYLRNHLHEHDEEYPYICKECFSVFTKAQDFERHCQTSEKCFMSIHHP